MLSEYHNATGFDSTLYVCLVGVLMSLYGLSGYEAGATMAEETSNAAEAAPRGMVEAVGASILTGLIFLVCLLLGLRGDVEGVLAGPTSQAVVNILSMTFSSWGAVILACALILNVFLSGFSHMTVTTRITYALVRDEALPGSRWMNHLNPETKNPDRVLLVVLILESLLCLLPLMSTTAFVAIT